MAGTCERRLSPEKKAAGASSCANAAQGAPVDRRITRSRKALRDAFVALTIEKGLDGFTVNDLCERAGLNRGTFYNHFRDKDDLLATLEDEVMADMVDFQERLAELTMIDVLNARARKQPLPFLVDLFDYVRSQGDFFRAVLGTGGDPAFGPRLRDAVASNLVHSILHERYQNEPTAFVGYYVSFYANAYLGVMARWIETGAQESSEEMALIAMRLLFIRPGESIEL